MVGLAVITVSSSWSCKVSLVFRVLRMVFILVLILRLCSSLQHYYWICELSSINSSDIFPMKLIIPLLPAYNYYVIGSLQHRSNRFRLLRHVLPSVCMSFVTFVTFKHPAKTDGRNVMPFKWSQVTLCYIGAMVAPWKGKIWGLDPLFAAMPPNAKLLWLLFCVQNER